MYDLRDYDTMFADPLRTTAVLAAIRAAVRPGDVVVEIGTGTGYFAVAAARAGARHVYAIERDDVAVVAREVVADNGVADRVTVIHGDASTVTLPERGTVLLEDTRGILPFNDGRIALLRDAWARHLVEGARCVIASDELWAAPSVRPAPDGDALVVLESTVHGIDRRAVERRLRDQWRRVRLDAGALLGAPARLLTLDVATVVDADAEARVAWTAGRDGTLDGIAVWFDAALAGGGRLSNAPAAPRLLYGQAYFPLTHPVPVRAGDTIRLDWRAMLVDGSYLFAWHTRVAPRDGGEAVEFRQSSLAAHAPALGTLLAAGATAGSRGHS
ncbi:MAG: 50S ribosomal protein L11 methyltransferase [Gemmatimonadetes bacterium]|nr:50S ribosomal protein L11 methyltransferase [Gemmatimonadota bacterium]